MQCATYIIIIVKHLKNSNLERMNLIFDIQKTLKFTSSTFGTYEQTQPFIIMDEDNPI